jgi:type I restriction enzyme, S subunit
MFKEIKVINKEGLPEHWKVKKLGEVCKIQTGKYDANHASINGKYRFYTCAFEYQYCNTNRFNGECIILPGNGANVGEVFYYNGEFDAYQRTYILNEITILPKFLYYHLKGFWKRRNEDKQFGSATNYIRMNNFLDYELFIPPIPEQVAIVSKIEELFSELDNGISQLKIAQQQLKVYRQSLLKAAFEGRLTNENVEEGEIPKDWKLVKLGDVSESCLGKMLDKSKNKGTYQPYLRNINVRWGHFDLDSLEEMRFESSEDERYSLKSHDLVICEGGEPGRCAIWNNALPNIKIQKALHRVRTNEKLLSEFLYYYFLFSSSIGLLNKYFTGTTIKHLTGKELKKIEILLPGISEQVSIVEILESKLTICDKLEQTIDNSLQQAGALRQSILKKAFEGKLITTEIESISPVIDADTDWLLAMVVGIIEKETRISYGEVVLQKTVYNCGILEPDFVKEYQFINSNYGTYSPELRDDLNANIYLEKKLIKNKEVFVLKEQYKEQLNESLLRYGKTHFVVALNNVLALYKTDFINKETNKIELLNTVFKAIRDTHSSKLKDIRMAMKNWKTPKAEYKNKAEKYSEKETKQCLELVIEKGWDKKLLN